MKSNKQQYRELSRKFLKNNRSNPDVVVLPSGLQYRILKMGEGPKPQLTSLVHVYYKGVLANGVEFDNNMNEPFPGLFRLFDVIEGWKEALLLMPEGSEYEVVIPYELGYGKRSNDNIPGYSTLVFHINLIKVE